MTSDLMVHERLRRIIVVCAALFEIIWLIIVRFYPMEYLWQIPHTALGNVLYFLGLLVVPLSMLAIFFALLVTTIYNPGGRAARVLGRFKPSDPVKLARLEKYSWLPADLLMFLTPFLVLAQIPYQDFQTGELDPMQVRIAWIGTIAMIPAWMIAVARWRSFWSISFMSAVHMARMGMYLLQDPGLFPSVWVVNGNSMLMALVLYLLVAAVRSAASSLDALMSEVTESRLEKTTRLATEMTRMRGRKVVKGPIRTAFRAAAIADDDESWLRAQDEARNAVFVMDKTLASMPTVESDTVTAEEFLATIKSEVASVTPQVAVQVSSVRILPVPRPVLNHLSATLCELVATAVDDDIMARFVSVQITVADRDITCQLTLAPGYTDSERLLGRLHALEETLVALPGASISTVSHVVSPRSRATVRLGRAEAGALAGVRLHWEPEAELLPDPADATGDLHGHLRLTNLVRGRLGVGAAICIFAFFYAYVISTALMSNPHMVSPWVNMVSLAVFLVMLSAVFLASGLISRWRAMPRVVFILPIVFSLALIGVSMANLGNLEDFSLEVEWWPLTIIMMTLTWVGGSTKPVYGFTTALVISIALTVWGFQIGEGPKIFSGAAIPLFIIVVLVTGLSAWVWQEIENAAQTRREDRVASLTQAHHLAANKERRAITRYLDDVARPFLLQLAAGMPRTAATHTRAKQLAYRVHDDFAAPVFQGTQVAQAAADARARGVTVELRDAGGLNDADPYVLGRTVRVAVNALDAMVDGNVVVKVHEPGGDQAAIVRSLPAAEEPRLIEVLPDGSVVYDGIRVRPTKQV